MWLSFEEKTQLGVDFCSKNQFQKIWNVKNHVNFPGVFSYNNISIVDLFLLLTFLISSISETFCFLKKVQFLTFWLKISENPIKSPIFLELTFEQKSTLRCTVLIKDQFFHSEAAQLTLQIREQMSGPEIS